MRSIPAVTKNLLIANLVAFVATLLLRSGNGIGGTDLNDTFGLHFLLAPDFRVWQLFTYMFMHASVEHIFFNMFALWMFGCVVERVWGPKRFFAYYVACGVGAGLFQEAAQFAQFYLTAAAQVPGFSAADVFSVAAESAGVLNLWTTVGASGAVYGILLAFGMIFPEERIFIFPLPVPIKAKWFVGIYAAIELFSSLSTSGDNVAHLAHLGGMVVGFFLIRHWRKTTYGGDAFGSIGGMFRKGGKTGFGFGGSKKTSSDDYVRVVDTRQADWDYNAKKKGEQDEVDRILDKIRKSGYDSLTAEEKRKLFEQSGK